MMYVQCTLRRGKLVYVSWIPATYAKYGRLLRLRDSKGEWQDGWIVAAVHDVVPPLREEQLPYVVAEVRNHRRATGDAEPKRQPHHAAGSSGRD